MRRLLLFSLVLTLVWTGCARQNRGLQNITRRDLAEPEVIQDVPCKQFAVFFDGGALMSCRLSEDADIGAARLPEHTIVRFHADGGLWYAFLPRPTEIEGHLCKGSGGEGAMTSFYPTGELRECWLAENTVIQGMPCIRSTVHGEIFGRLAGKGGPCAVFYRSGNLHSCKLSENIEIDGMKHKKGTRIMLPDGPAPD
jgi:hypothetical protein